MKDAVYELILTPSEAGAIKAALDAAAEEPQHPALYINRNCLHDGRSRGKAQGTPKATDGES